MAGRGRPTDYKPEYADQAKILCDRMAATDDDLAAFFGVTTRSISNWKVKHQEFFLAIAESKGPANERVKQSLYKLATGYHYMEIEHKVVGGKLRAIEVERYVPPNAVAQTFWLKNREPDQWRDKQELEVDLKLSLGERMAAARKRMAGASDDQQG